MSKELRKTRCPLYLATCAIIFSGSYTALAQSDLQDGSQRSIAADDIPDEILVNSLRRNTAREQYISQMVRPLRDLERDSSGLSQVEIDRNATIARTRERAQNANRFLSNDFNGDLRVDIDEILQYSPQGSPDQARRQAQRTIEQFDVNEDGVATLEEALSVTPSYRRGNRQNDRLKQLLALDPNGDGVLTSQELLTIAGDTFDRFDLNANGVIDEIEEGPIKQARQIASDRARLREIGCNFPAISPKAQFVSFGTYSASVLSATYLGRPEFVTGIAEVEIEAGKGPIYLMLGSVRPTIWRFSGATDRIEHVIVGSQRSHTMDPASGAQQNNVPRTSAAGVIGIGKSKVSFAPIGCLRGAYQASEDRRQQADAIAVSVGRARADKVGSEGNVYHVLLPSLTTKRPLDEYPASPVQPRYESTLWKDVLRGDLDDIIRVDPDEVVSAEPVDLYKVLPHHFGIAQLVREGVLEPDDQNRMVIKRSFAHWPANMMNGRPLAFVLDDGVQVPEPEPGVACVLSRSEAANDAWKTICDAKLRPPPPISSRAARPSAASSRASSAPVSQARAAAPRNQMRWMLRVLDTYPAKAKREGIEGTVGVSTNVTPRGRASNCRVVSSSGSELLDQAACKGLLRYARFDPALDNLGNPTTGAFHTRVTYRQGNNAEPAPPAPQAPS